jgi:hypothetical protein
MKSEQFIQYINPVSSVLLIGLQVTFRPVLTAYDCLNQKGLPVILSASRGLQLTAASQGSLRRNLLCGAPLRPHLEVLPAADDLRNGSNKSNEKRGLLGLI